MNRKRYNICFGILLLLAAGCFQSCVQEEDFEPTTPGALLSQGRYLGARNGSANAVLEDDDTTQFAVNTPYRLLAFTKGYDPKNPDDTTPATYLRFNKVAWEGATPGGLHYVNIEEADRWLGFAAYPEECTAGVVNSTDDLVSLDFYAFTYGKAVGEGRPSTDYIKLEGQTEDQTENEWVHDNAVELADLKYTESIAKDETGAYTGPLNDLMYSRLLNRNIGNAGLTAATATQSIMYFQHCFSQLIFCVAQQYKEETVDGKTVTSPYFPGLQVENVEVTNTYGTGSVYLQDGKVKPSGGLITRPLQFHDAYKAAHNGVVTTEEVEMGRMIVFPSHSTALRDTGDLPPDGYPVGLKITVKSTNREDIANLTGSPGTIAEETVGETKYYRGTIVMDRILDHVPDDTGATEVGDTKKTLYFKQHTRYRLVIVFSKESVRIITVIPQVEEWLPGEVNDKGEPWQDQAMGQPQMFDNVLWSDRNLGADHYDPTGAEFEKTIGYFYQSGRNIPYFPFNTMDYYTDEYEDRTRTVTETDKDGNEVTKEITERYYKMKTFPSPDKKRDKKLAESGSYDNTTHRFFPMVDEVLLNMKNKEWGRKAGGSNGPDRIWTISWEPAQLEIPQAKPQSHYFDFRRDNLADSENMYWDKPDGVQPVRGAWVVPSSKDFMKIFPTTPDAGNIAFRRGDDNNSPINNWSTHTPMSEAYTTLRVTVPYYTSEMHKMTDDDIKADENLNWRNQDYIKAWKLLRDNDDAGTTHLDAYDNNNWSGPKAKCNRDLEPDGDPEDGYASVYVISRVGKDKYGVPELIKDDTYSNGKKKYMIQSWGTIYAIKRVYTEQAYRMRWRVICAETYGTEENRAAAMYVEICRYRCNKTDRLNEQNYLTDYDWDHPAATLYFPICGLGDNVGTYINFGTECQYATSDPISGGKSGAVHLKVTGDDDSNAFIAVLSKTVDRKFCKQIRPIRGGVLGSDNQ